MLLLGVGNAMAGTLKVAKDDLAEYEIYDSDVTDILLPNQVTIDGKSTGTLSYNSNAHKLTFNNVHRTSSLRINNGWRTFFLYDNTTPLTIELVGDNELTVEQTFNVYARLFFGNIKIVGDGSLKLNLKSSHSGNTSFLRVVDGDVDMQGTGVVEMTLSNYNILDYEYTYAATGVKLQEGMMLSNSSYTITTTKETELIQYVYRENGGLNFDRSRNNAIWLRIEPLKKYNLHVANQQVNWINMTDILGDGHVKYEPANNQLTLNNANIHYEYNGSGYKPDVFNYSYIDYPNVHITGIDPSTFKVMLKGRNTVTGVVNIATNASFRGFMQNCTFVGDGTLEMDLSANVEAPGVYGFSTQGSGRNKSVTLDPSFTGWVSVSASNVGSKPAAVFETADCQLILPNTTDYFVAKSSTLPVVALTPATTNTNLYVAHVNFGKADGSPQATLRLINSDTFLGTNYVGKKLSATIGCALQAMGGQAPFYYTAANLPGGLTIDPETGVISGTYTTPNSLPNPQVTLTATDLQGRQTTMSINQPWVYGKMTTDNSSLTGLQWTRNVAIPSINLSSLITNGAGQYTFTVLAPTSILGNTRLPAGVLLSSDGVISGTPTGGGNFKTAIQVTDAIGQVAGFVLEGHIDANYDFRVAGTLVTSSNMNNISVKGQTSGTISYDPETETLTFDNVIAYTTSASTPYFVDSKISKINVVGDNRITYTGSTISGVSEYYGFPGNLDIYGDGQFNFASGRNGLDSYAVNGNVTVKDNATILLFSYYAAVNGTLTVPMNQVIYTAGRSGNSAGEWTMLNGGVTQNVSNYTNKYVKTEMLADGALCFTDEKDSKTIYKTVPVKPFTMFDVEGGVAPYTYSATSLPSGLAIDAETGYISGTASGNSTGTVTFTVTDAMGREITADMNLVVESPLFKCKTYGGSIARNGDATTWTQVMQTPIEDGQLLLAEPNFDLDETTIEIPENKNIILRDVNGKTYANNITLKDGVKYAFPYEVDANSISYTRNFKNTNWQSLYIPFTLNYEDWYDDFDVAYLNDVHQFDDNNDGEIEKTVLEYIQVKSGSIEPNCPYIIKAKTTGEKILSVENCILEPAESNSIDCSSTRTLYTFTGIYEPTPFDAHTVYAYSGGALKQGTQTITLGSYRWYLDITDRNSGKQVNNAKISIQIDGEEEETSIDDVYRNTENASVYTISGIKIGNTDSLAPGVYIKNGKKYMIE